MNARRSAPHRRQSERPTAHLIVLAWMAAAMASSAAAETRHAAKSVKRSQPVPTSHAAPDVTGAIPSAAAPPRTTPATAGDDKTLPKPFELPTAPRARVHTCGERWQGIKLSGTAGAETWREFATSCLAQKDAPHP